MEHENGDSFPHQLLSQMLSSLYLVLNQEGGLLFPNGWEGVAGSFQNLTISSYRQPYT